MYLVSSCLAGHSCRYNATHCLDQEIKRLIQNKQAATACPELLGGLPVPREPAEIQGGTGKDVLEGKAKVLTVSGIDVTDAFIEGARRTLAYAQKLKAHTVVLKENSPSCGSRTIYDGSFQGTKSQGEGVTSAMLRINGFRVISEDEFLLYVRSNQQKQE
ncbi:DUF523 domain-containing protein [Bacillus sp. 1P06AnD]|uniref:DUF523 domain-containing protein n=1 Tax=Bacillus sp. 1P06AnD TaxID=3132208 RepID=UPI00399FE8A9